MADLYPNICHKFDRWYGTILWMISFSYLIFVFRHFLKGIKVRIFKAGKLKSCKLLLKWQQSVANMIWYALSHAQGITKAK